MNRFRTNVNGGTKLFSDDIAFIDASVRDAFKGLVSVFGVTASNSFKISGCVVTNVGLVYSWSSGYICFFGEILKVVAGSVTIPSTPQAGYGLYWGLDVSYHIDGAYRQNHDTYEIRQSKLFYGMLPESQIGVTDYMPAYATTIQDKILELYSSSDLIAKITTSELVQKLMANEETWKEVGSGFINDWGNGGGTLETAGYKIDNFGVVHLKGVIIKGASNSNAMFQLTQKYRPSKTRAFSTCQIGTDGYVYAVPLASQVQLDGISYKL